MKILFVSAYFAYPEVAHGGGTDLFHLIEALSARHEVHLVSFADAWELVHAEDMRHYCRTLNLIVPANRWANKLRNAGQTIRIHPLRALFLLGRRSHGEMRRLIRELVVSEGIELVQFEWTEAAQFWSAVPPGTARLVLDEVDVSCRPLEQKAMLERHPVGRVLAQRRYRRARAKELALCRRFDAVLTRSESDRAFLASLLPGSAVSVFSPWTRVAEFAGVKAEESERDLLLFVGAMDRQPNEDAVLFFCQKILPAVRRAVPQVRLMIVGTDPTAPVRALAADPAVIVTGYVPDLLPYYAGCSVFVAPLRIGGGVINKTIDAMAAGRPVVTTPAGNLGLGAPDGALLVAEEPEEFARKVVALLREEGMWRKVATRGRAYVQQVFDWPATVARMEEFYEEILPQCPIGHPVNGSLVDG